MVTVFREGVVFGDFVVVFFDEVDFVEEDFARGAFGGAFFEDVDFCAKGVKS